MLDAIEAICPIQGKLVVLCVFPGDNRDMGQKILIIDDSAVVRKQLSVVLRQAGFDVLEAADGLAGGDQIRSCADVALVLCDVNMPKQDGLEMLESLKDEIATRALPVLMLTTEAEAKTIARARTAGAKGWIVKPFKTEMLLDAVKRFVS